MKVYAVTNDLELLIFNSIKSFESKHSWVDSDFIQVVTSKDIELRGFPYSESNDGCLIQLTQDELAAHKLINSATTLAHENTE